MSEKLIRPTQKEVEENNLPIRLIGVKVAVKCETCGKAWTVFFDGEDSLTQNLPSYWWKCSTCREKGVSHG